ncbi:MAG TPA: TonB-dependent receptor [Bryobacteraceae bacterium]|jgi:iron complex outermembrane receptor protein
MRISLPLRISIAPLLVSITAFAGDDGARPASDPFAQDLPVVEAASLHTQTLDEAPASVTVISHADIRVHGYRTLGEALGSVRGFFLTNDHIYQYAGVRGFSLAGDFNTRFLVMINGHPMTENIFSSNGFFEQDFGLDMDLVERIEVVRGPSSALYGSNGIFATINIVTMAPVDFAQGYSSIEAGSFGQKKALAAGSFYLGKGANLLLSASAVDNGGQSYFFPEMASPGLGSGHADGMDGERAYHTFANLTWHNWSILAYFNDRDKNPPLAWTYSANTFFSRGNHVMDGRNFVSVAYTRKRSGGTLRWQLSYDNYRYQDRFDTVSDPAAAGPLMDLRSYALGDWLTSRLTYQFGAGRLGTLTAGLEGSVDFRNLQYNLEVQPQPQQLLYISRPDRNAAIFLQQEKRLSARWKLDLGVRLDQSRYYSRFVSPRAALSYQASPHTVYKLIYGRPYRNPSAYEQFYVDNVTFIQPPQLKPESANTFDATVEHHFGSHLSGSINLYDYELHGLIQANYFDDTGASQFQNAEAGRSRGAEFEFGGKLKPWLETSGSFSWQQASLSNAAGFLGNSPERIAKFQWATPLTRRVTLAGNVQALSSRFTYDGDPIRPVVLVDLTATLRRAVPGCDLTLGARNLLNWGYDDPTGLSRDKLPGDPRSLFVKLAWSAGR